MAGIQWPQRLTQGGIGVPGLQGPYAQPSKNLQQWQLNLGDLTKLGIRKAYAGELDPTYLQGKITLSKGARRLTILDTRIEELKTFLEPGQEMILSQLIDNDPQFDQTEKTYMKVMLGVTGQGGKFAPTRPPAVSPEVMDPMTRQSTFLQEMGTIGEALPRIRPPTGFQPEAERALTGGLAPGYRIQGAPETLPPTEKLTPEEQAHWQEFMEGMFPGTQTAQRLASKQVRGEPVGDIATKYSQYAQPIGLGDMPKTEQPLMALLTLGKETLSNYAITPAGLEMANPEILKARAGKEKKGVREGNLLYQFLGHPEEWTRENMQKKIKEESLLDRLAIVGTLIESLDLSTAQEKYLIQQWLWDMIPGTEAPTWVTGLWK